MALKVGNLKVGNLKVGHLELGNLYGPEGNAFVILARVRGALRNYGRSKADVDAWVAKAQAGNYAELLQLVLDTFSVSRQPKLQAAELIKNYKGQSQ